MTGDFNSFPDAFNPAAFVPPTEATELRVHEQLAKLLPGMAEIHHKSTASVDVALPHEHVAATVIYMTHQDVMEKVVDPDSASSEYGVYINTDDGELTADSLLLAAGDTELQVSDMRETVKRMHSLLIANRNSMYPRHLLWVNSVLSLLDNDLELEPENAGLMVAECPTPVLYEQERKGIYYFNNQTTARVRVTPRTLNTDALTDFDQVTNLSLVLEAPGGGDYRYSWNGHGRRNQLELHRATYGRQKAQISSEHADDVEAEQVRVVEKAADLGFAEWQFMSHKPTEDGMSQLADDLEAAIESGSSLAM